MNGYDNEKYWGIGDVKEVVVQFEIINYLNNS
jgi:hypothetical protein